MSAKLSPYTTADFTEPLDLEWTRRYSRNTWHQSTAAVTPHVCQAASSEVDPGWPTLAADDDQRTANQNIQSAAQHTKYC